MASTIKVDNVQNTPGTNIINKCGATITVGAACNSVAVTGNIVKSNALQASDGGNIVNQCGTDITLGASGDTITLASGASQSGFGRTGTVDWVTTPKVTGDSPVTAATGSGYFLNTTAGTITLNLPAGAAGSIVSFADYAATWQTYAVTVSPNGSEKIGGINADVILTTEGQSVTLVYVDSTQGWVNTMDSTSNVRANEFMVATGGTPACGTTSGDYKIHKFTGPGTFCVSATSATPGCNVVSYMVVAGGGGAQCSGGGGGGFREYKNSCDPYTASPLDGNPCGTAITVTATGYPITVGAGGPGHPGKASGADSIFSSITSAGGGYAGAGSPGVGIAGGSGGGSTNTTGGAGNTPPVTPPQGNPGGTASGYSAAGGGATTAGGNFPGPHIGGTGATTCITASPVGYAGGGGGASPVGGAVARPPCGSGGAGIAGSQAAPGTQCGVVNSGGGGGGVYCCTQGAGGSGVVVIRYKFQ